MKRIVKITCVLFVAVLLLAGCSGNSAKITELADLEGKIVAAMSSPQDPEILRAVLEQRTDVKFKEMLFYDTVSAAVAALKSGKADAVLVFGPMRDFYISRDDGLTAVDLPSSGKTTLHMALRASDAELRDRIDAALLSMRNDGTLASLEKEFVADLTPDKQLTGKDMPKFDGAPKLTVGLSGETPPVDYVAADGKPAGYNVELLALLSEALQVNFELNVMPMESKFPALASNKIDLFFLHAVNANIEMTIKTLEANNSATITEPYYEYDVTGYLVLK